MTATTAVHPARVALRADRRARLDVLDVGFLLAALLSPLEIRLALSFTAHDAVIVVLAFLIIAGPVRMRWLPRSFLPAVYVFLLVASVSAFRATYPVEAVTQTLSFAFVFFVQIPVILTVVRSRKMLWLSLGCIVLGSLAVIALAALSPREAGAGRLLAIFSDSPNRLGYPAAYVLPFVLVFVREWWRRGLHVPAILTAAGVTYLFVWALAASASRGAAAAAVVALLLALGLPRGPELKGRVFLRFVAVAAMIVVGLLVSYRSPIFPPTLKDRIERTLAAEDSLVGDREQLAIAGLRAFRESPLVGTGLDNFRYVATLYGDGVGEQAPHNMWIQFAAQVGIIGTIAFFVIIARWFQTVLRARSATTERTGREMLWAFVVSMLALMIIFMTIPVMVERHYWIIAGLGLALALGSEPQAPATPAGEQARGRRQTR